eukprot:Sdes_comp23482_c0_seq1m21720
MNEIEENLNQSIKKSLTDLQNIWDDIGLDSCARVSRCTELVSQTQNLFHSLISKETERKTALLLDVANATHDLRVLSTILSVPFEMPSEGLALIEKHDFL